MSSFKSLLLKTLRIETYILSSGRRETSQTLTRHQSSNRKHYKHYSDEVSLNTPRPYATNHSIGTKHSQRDCKPEERNNEKVQNNLKFSILVMTQGTEKRRKKTGNQFITYVWLSNSMDAHRITQQLRVKVTLHQKSKTRTAL